MTGAMTRIILLLAAMLVTVGCAGTSDGDSVSMVGIEPDLVGRPTQWNRLDLAPFNRQIDQAVAEGAGWTSSPLRTIIEIFGDDTDQRTLSIEEKKNSGEGANEVSFVIVRDGFLDDSIRGSWTEVVLKRGESRVWRVAEGRIAFRCRRAADPEAWTTEPCP